MNWTVGENGGVSGSIIRFFNTVRVNIARHVRVHQEAKRASLLIHAAAHGANNAKKTDLGRLGTVSHYCFINIASDQRHYVGRWYIYHVNSGNSSSVGLFMTDSGYQFFTQTMQTAGKCL
ncbi:hypothetical protein [Profundibacter sp.]